MVDTTATTTTIFSIGIIILLAVSATQGKPVEVKTEPAGTSPPVTTGKTEVDSCMRPCPRNLKEVCASNGKVYGNQCLFEIAKCKSKGLELVPCAKDEKKSPPKSKKLEFEEKEKKVPKAPKVKTEEPLITTTSAPVKSVLPTTNAKAATASAPATKAATAPKTVPQVKTAPVTTSAPVTKPVPATEVVPATEAAPATTAPPATTAAPEVVPKTNAMGCPLGGCLMMCQYGFEKDNKGCDICVCKKEKKCPLTGCNPALCKNGFEEDENGCQTCKCKKPVCPVVACNMFCKHGFEEDKNGCEICVCKKDKMCPLVACNPALCKYGFQEDKNGCTTCKCKTQCPLTGCNPALCKYGFEEDKNGCTTCKCKKPDIVPVGPELKTEAPITEAPATEAPATAAPETAAPEATMAPEATAVVKTAKVPTEAPSATEKIEGEPSKEVIETDSVTFAGNDEDNKVPVEEVPEAAETPEVAPPLVETEPTNNVVPDMIPSDDEVVVDNSVEASASKMSSGVRNSGESMLCLLVLTVLYVIWC